MDVLYYYYFLFYTHVLPDDEPHATVVFTLSFSESLVVNGLFNIVIAKVFCLQMELWPMLITFIIVLGINYLVYSRNKRGSEIVKNKPQFFSSKSVSVLVTATWFLVSLSFMFVTPFYIKEILDRCR